MTFNPQSRQDWIDANWNEFDSSIVECPDCEGSGKVGDECPHCGCSCNGNDEECDRCEGDGYIPLGEFDDLRDKFEKEQVLGRIYAVQLKHDEAALAHWVNGGGYVPMVDRTGVYQRIPNIMNLNRR